MVCTFGDQTDVLWWREQACRSGRSSAKRHLLPPTSARVSAEPEPDAARGFYDTSRLTVKEAQRRSSTASRASRQRPSEHRRRRARPSSTPSSSTRRRSTARVRHHPQWFVRVMDKKQQLIEAGTGSPGSDFMRLRFRNWTRTPARLASAANATSACRFRLVPLTPRPGRLHPAIVPRRRPPVDPMASRPGYSESQRDAAAGSAPSRHLRYLVHELADAADRKRLLLSPDATLAFPMDCGRRATRSSTWPSTPSSRPPARETIPGAHRDLGWCSTRPQEMSKSKGNVLTPVTCSSSTARRRALLSRTRSRIDTAFDEKS